MVQGDSTLQDLSDCIDHVNYGLINFNHRVFICEISCNDKKNIYLVSLSSSSSSFNICCHTRKPTELHYSERLNTEI